MGTPLASLSTNDLIYDFMLASRWRSPYVFDPDGALAKDADVWGVLQNDADIASCVQRRNQSIVRPWRVVANPHGTSKSLGQEAIDASRRLAAICHEGLSNIDRFDAARCTLAEAFVLGRRYAKIYWQEQVTSLDGTPPMRWFLPVKLKDADRRRFHWEPVWSSGPSPKKIRVDLKMFDTNQFNWVTLTRDERRTYIEYVWDDTEDRLGYGNGAMQALFFTHYFKTGTMKRLIEGVDRWANGFLIGKIDSLRAASTDLDNATLTTRMKEMLQKVRTDHVGVVEKTDDLQLLEPTGKGLQTALDLVRYFNESAERYCNGSVRPAGHSVDGTGSKGAGKTEEDTSESFYQFPREDLDSVLDRDLLGSFLYYNEGNFKEIGLENAKRPRFKSEQVKRQDPATRIEVLNQSKVPILLSEYYDAIEATPPGPDDEIVDASPDPAMADMELDEESGFPKSAKDSPEREKIKAQKEKPAKMENEESVARFDAIERRFDSLTAMLSGGRSQETHLHVPETLKVPVPIVNVPAPIVNVAAAQVHVPPAVAHFTQGAAPVVNLPPMQTVVNVPQGPAPVAHFTAQAPSVTIEDAKSAAVLDRLVGIVDKFFGWFMGRKPEKTVTVARQQDGTLRGTVKEE